jgi:YbbR domain-containing protein
MIVKVVRFIVHNWPLKIGAVVLAAILYVGMVYLQTSAQWPGSVAIDVVNQPAGSYLVSPLQEVGSIRYIAQPNVPISRATFRATADLTNAKVSESDSSLVKVLLIATDPRVQIIDYQPQQIRVQLDPVVHKQVNVQVVTGAIPSGLQPGTPVLSAQTADVSGAASIVRHVVYAEARVRVDASGLDVDQNVDLVARDASDQIVSNVTFDPRAVQVRIQVGSQIRSETVPIKPDITNSPAAGYVIASVTISPPVVTVRGQADALGLLKGQASTKPISVAGATSDVSVNVALNLPNGVTSDVSGTVSVVIHLQAQTSTRSLTIGVVPDGARPDRNYSLSTLSVTVTLGGATAALNALDTSTLVATASVGDLGVGTFTVTVKINVPPGIKVVAWNPVAVIVTITVSPTPSPTP